MTALFPLLNFGAIEREELNAQLTAWGHRMGPCRRATDGFSHGLHHEGQLIAVVATDTLIRERCAGLARSEAVELSRLCAVRPDLCRVALRLWREFVFRPLADARGYAWAVSYQDEALHPGDVYRLDGWFPLARSRGGVDPRTGRKGRGKTIWGWSPDAALMAGRRAPTLAVAT